MNPLRKVLYVWKRASVAEWLLTLECDHNERVPVVAAPGGGIEPPPDTVGCSTCARAPGRWSADDIRKAWDERQKGAQ